MSSKALLDGRASSNLLHLSRCLSIVPSSLSTIPSRHFHNSAIYDQKLRGPARRTRRGPNQRNPSLPSQENGIIDADQFAIRFFEQDKIGNVRQLQDSEDFERSVNGLDDIDSLEKDLAGLVSVSNDDLSPEKLNQVIGKYFPDIVRKAQENARKKLEAEQRPTPFPDSRRTRTSPVEQQPEYTDEKATFEIDVAETSRSGRKKITQLNEALRQADRSFRRNSPPTKKVFVAVWRAYLIARTTLALSWDVVPPATWDLLWRVCSCENVNNPNRLSHVASLAKDMSVANVSLNPAQQLLTIEALFEDNWEEMAFKNWKRNVTTLGEEGSGTFQAFWELGVRMSCKRGDLDQAERILEKLVEAKADPRKYIPFIQACTEESSAESIQRARNAYQRLRSLLEDTIQLRDFDKVISSFLAANQAEIGLYIFVDMMTGGNLQLEKIKQRSRGRYWLPPSIGNKFFFGKWLKRLTSGGELEMALKVIGLMLQLGVRPAPIHVNVLIGALQRSGGAEDTQKAEELAWDMIHERLHFIQIRKQSTSIDAQEAVVSEHSPPSMSGTTIRLPPATLETFSLLAENYRQRRLSDKLKEVWVAFNEAEIPKNAFMMNQLLEAYVQDNEYDEAMKLYHSLVGDGLVKPNSHSLMVLWKMLKINRYRLSASSHLDEEIQATRARFAETIAHSDVFDGQIDGRLARKILHTFRRLQDYDGLVVALRVFWHHLHFIPSELIVLELVMGTTSLSWETARARERLQKVKMRIDADIADQREERGASLEVEEISSLERHRELYNYLVRTYRRRSWLLSRLGEVDSMYPETLDEQFPAGEIVDNSLVEEEVAREMGVYDILAGFGSE